MKNLLMIIMTLSFLIIHCLATPEGREVYKKDLDQWHLVERGWERHGYTDFIQLDGNIVNLTPFDQDDDVDGYEITNGVLGKNGIARHIAYVGGLDKNFEPKDTRTREQKITLIDYTRYMVRRHRNIKVAGHYQFDDEKPFCPGFDVIDFCRTIGILEKNIYKPPPKNVLT